jgi:hypothetical protein
MSRCDFECHRQFTFGIDSQVEFVAEPLHFVAERIELRSPVSVTGLFTSTFRLLLFVGVDGGAVNGDMGSIDDPSLLTGGDEDPRRSVWLSSSVSAQQRRDLASTQKELLDPNAARIDSEISNRIGAVDVVQ